MAIRKFDGHRGAKAVKPVLSTFLLDDKWFSRTIACLTYLVPASAPLCLFVPSLWMSEPDQALLPAEGLFCCLE